jgi:3-mercaptopyruvate sulfurtransferase SseA
MQGSLLAIETQSLTSQEPVISRVAVLDGGYPSWKAGGHPIDSITLDNGEVDAPAQAAANPPASTRYPAELQVASLLSALSFELS